MNIELIGRRKKQVAVPILEFNAANTTPSAGSLTNVIGPNWTVVRNSIATYKTSDTTVAQVAANVPRIENRAVLIESASTNIMPNSNNLNTLTKSNCTLTVNTAISPLGTQTAATVVYTSPAYGPYFTDNGAWNIGEGFNISCWLRADSPVELWIGANDKSAAPEGKGAKKITVGTEWARYDFDYTNGRNGTTGGYPSVATKDISAADTDHTPACTVYMWSFQWEKNQPVSSYIPTSGTSLTRAADVITVAVPAGRPPLIMTETIRGIQQPPVAVTEGQIITMKNGTTKLVINQAEN